jgi:hypothetical protein
MLNKTQDVYGYKMDLFLIDMLEKCVRLPEGNGDMVKSNNDTETHLSK